MLTVCFHNKTKIVAFWHFIQEAKTKKKAGKIGMLNTNPTALDILGCVQIQIRSQVL